mmetsp:Transcript_32835/g.67216  ORF Transcript_32835/g.67216 Transcript_32835/m.67216 type:complete len:86 (-) Transcript_32835:71-328(-)
MAMLQHHSLSSPPQQPPTLALVDGSASAVVVATYALLRLRPSSASCRRKILSFTFILFTLTYVGRLSVSFLNETHRRDVALMRLM